MRIEIDTVALVAFCRRRADLEATFVLQLALPRAVEVVGEAAWRVSESPRRECPDVPWRAVVGMRNCLIPGYDTVDLGLLGDPAATDLPSQLDALERNLGEKQ